MYSKKKREKTFEELEAENRRENFWVGLALLLVIIFIDILLGLAGIPVHWGPVS